MTFRRLVKLVAVAVMLAAVAVSAFVVIRLLDGKTGGAVQVVNAPAELVARGKYLAEAADCAACHSAPGGAPYAGGLAMQSGFGTIYATNITPDPDNGIGRWSADDFWRALHDGIRRDGQQLYPAHALHILSRHETGGRRCDLRLCHAVAADEGGEPPDAVGLSL
jgi:hypothetical protein